VARRRTVVVACSGVLMLLTLLLAILELTTDFYFGNALVYSMAIFGLSSFFSMAFFYFLVLSAL
jgi:hypothetical protein